MRVVFDTNIVISGLLWSGTPRIILQIAIERKVHAITSEALLDELRDVLKREKFHKYVQRIHKTPDALVTDYLQYTTIIEPIHIPQNSVRDIDDVKVLEAAIGGNATYIVSGDDDLLVLRKYAHIPIMTAREFIETTINES